jgi:hypothetical protein
MGCVVFPRYISRNKDKALIHNNPTIQRNIKTHVVFLFFLYLFIAAFDVVGHGTIPKKNSHNPSQYISVQLNPLSAEGCS